jgi:hypothetical protein
VELQKYFPCPETGCGEPALIESLAAEEFMVRRGDELARKQPALQRIFWGTCPVHGRVMGLQIGHDMTVPRETWKQLE